MKVVLIDDEVHCTESLEIMLKQLGKSIEIVAKFNNPINALPYLQDHTFDILFLDIEMPKLNGFELLSILKDFTFDVVFTTAYNQYAIEAFKYSALNYLLKPIDSDELLACINKWEEKQQKNMPYQQFSQMMEMLQNNMRLNAKIALPTTYGFEFIEIDKIVRCQSESNYSHIYFKEGEPLLICRTLKEVENLLSAHGFIRVHQSHLINPKYLKKFLRNDGGYVVMEDGEKISVSKINKDKVTAIFNQIERN